MGSHTITFFERFEPDILAGKKTITIRDEPDSHYEVGSIVRAVTDETGREFCRMRILAVEPVSFSELSESHATRENMTLDGLRSVIGDIYPGIEKLYVVSFETA